MHGHPEDAKEPLWTHTRKETLQSVCRVKRVSVFCRKQEETQAQPEEQGIASPPRKVVAFVKINGHTIGVQDMQVDGLDFEALFHFQHEHGQQETPCVRARARRVQSLACAGRGTAYPAPCFDDL